MFPINKFKKIAILSVSILILLGVLFFFLISLETVQTRLAQRITQNVNNRFNTDISIQKASISLKGDVSIRDILIQDHHQDSLIFIQELKTSLDGMDRFLNRVYDFKSIGLDGVHFFLTQYKGESESSLQHFIAKLKDTSRLKPKPFSFKTEILNVNNSKLVVENLNVSDSKNSFWGIDLALESFNFDKKTLDVDVKSLQASSDAYGSLDSFEAMIRYSPDSLLANNFRFKVNKNDIRGSASVAFHGGNLANFNPAEFKIYIDESTIQLNEISFLKPYLNHHSVVKADLFAQGNLKDFDLEIKLIDEYRSSLEGAFRILNGFKKNEAKYSSKALTIKTSNRSLKALFKERIHDQFKLYTNRSGEIIINSDIVGSKNNWDFTSEIKTDLGNVSPVVKLQRTSLQFPWQFKADLAVDNFDLGQLLNKKTKIKSTASIELRGILEKDKPFSLESMGEIKQLLIGKNTFNEIKFSAEYNNGLTTAIVNSSDSLHHFNLDVDFDKIKKTFNVMGEIYALNLSNLGLADGNSNMILSTKLSINKSEIISNKGGFVFKLETPVIRDKEKHTEFKDLNLTAQSRGRKQSVTILDSDAINLLVDGNFKYKDFPSLVQEMLNSFLFIKPIKIFAEKQSFNFDIQMKSKLTEALFPNLSTPDDFFLSGLISSDIEETAVIFDIPILSFKNYGFRGLHFETDSKNPVYTSFMSADQIRIGEFEANQLFLISSPFEQKNQIRLEGILGDNTSNTFEANLSYQKEDKIASIDISQFIFRNNNTLWKLSENSEQQIFFNTQTGNYRLNSFSVFNSNQSIQISGNYKTKEEFDFQLNSNNVALGPLLPHSENFYVQGNLNSDIRFYRTPSRNDATLSINLSDLIFNDVAMGDLTINSSGNTILNSYKNSIVLESDGVKKLNVTGGILLSDKRTSLDLEVKMNAFDMSFLSRMGKGKITDVKSFLTGNFNLWGPLNNLSHSGNLILDNFNLTIPFTNTSYGLEDSTQLTLFDQVIKFQTTTFFDQTKETNAQLKGAISHVNFKDWSLDLDISSDRLMLMNRFKEKGALFYGTGYLNGDIHVHGPTKNLIIDVDGATAKGTSIIIPWEENTGLADVSFIDFYSKSNYNKSKEKIEDKSNEIKIARGLEMTFDLDVNNNAQIEIVVDQVSGSTLTGRGSGNLLMETNIDGKFNMWGDFIVYEGIYNFKNLGLIDKKFNVNPGGTIIWEGDPLEAQMNIEAVYEVPGGANPALLVDNPNFNKKIPTNVLIKLQGSLLKPDNPMFEISFPNTSGIVASEINYRLADQQRRQLQAVSLLSQGIFVSDVSFSTQGIANNLYEKASDVLSSILGESDGKLDFGLNYLKGDERPDLDIRSQDRIGVTFVTQISDKILLNGKIGVPVGGVEETLIVGDVQIDFILNEEGTLKAKVFNKENEFRYISDDLGYTQGVGLSYQVDFKTFEDLIQKIISIKKNFPPTQDD